MTVRFHGLPVYATKLKIRSPTDLLSIRAPFAGFQAHHLCAV
jgi:hypothetical protein